MLGRAGEGLISLELAHWGEVAVFPDLGSLDWREGPSEPAGHLSKDQGGWWDSWVSLCAVLCPG